MSEAQQPDEDDVVTADFVPAVFAEGIAELAWREVPELAAGGLQAIDVRLRRFVAEQPGVTLALALGCGFLLGRLLSR